MDRFLAKAEDARRRGSYRRAIAAYRRALVERPGDPSIHARLAPLLASKGRGREAVESFIIAATDQLTRGFVDRAIGLYRGAARAAPRDVRIWRALGELHLERKHPVDAVRALLEGAGHMRRRRDDRPDAITLLRAALAIDPLQVDATIELALLLRRVGKRAEAVALLEALLPHVDGRAVRALRFALFRVHRTLGNLWRWLRPPRRATVRALRAAASEARSA
jgi:tetratricopeptide (TPR) repeat protein